MEQNWLDIQHRGYWAYLQETQDHAACKRLCRTITSASGKADRMDTVLYDCEIDLQWIEKIEARLPFIENALKESRQFILRQGEIVPIEKAKRVSRASVEHLSRHSELITRLPEPNESLTPDKLYITENVGTYAVYENRFLYMLLRELQDFISYRYRRIREITESFSAELELGREIADGQRSIRYHLSFQESDQTPEDLVSPETRRTLSRIAMLLQEVDQLLKTPLMVEVSGAPLLRPPITRTNVLLHNPNFVAAFDLYCFLTEYEGEGFQATERQRNEEDALSQTGWEIATLVSLTSYLSHRWGGMQEALEERFEAAQDLRRKQTEQEQKVRLAQLKARSGESLEAALAYMLELEQRNESLEAYSDQIAAAKALHLETQEQLELALQTQTQLQAQIALLENTVVDKDQLIRQAELDQERLRNTIRQHQEQEAARLDALRQEHNLELQRQKNLFLQEYEALAETLRVENARDHARGDTDADLSSREAFAELEAEYAAFRRFYQRQWKAAKRNIRKEHLK